MRRSSTSGMKKTPQKVLSDPNTRAELIDVLMKDPVKRAMVLELINSEKDAIKEYKKRERLKQTQSPAEKLKRKYVIESPTSLMRRRALLEMERAESGSSCSSSSSKTFESAPSSVVSSKSAPSSVVSFKSAPSTVVSSKSASSPVVPFERILKNIVVYVEVMSNGEDRSDGVKTLLINMGAIVVDQITREVTHVIFKDGSYLTYQRAKLMKIHLVSIVWLDSCRTTGCRVSERDYPALGNCNSSKDVNLICDKLQNEYTEIVRGEMRKSMSNNDIHSQQSQQNKMALLSQLGEINEQQLSSSQDVIPDSQDLEVRKINYSMKNSLISEESDADSSCGVVNGFSGASKSCVQKMNSKELVLKIVTECNISDDIIISSNDEVTKTKQQNNEDVVSSNEYLKTNEQHNSDDVIVSSNDCIKPNEQRNSEDAVSLNKYTKTNDTISPKKKRRTMFNLKTDENSYVTVLNDEVQRKSRRTLKTEVKNTKLDKKSTPSVTTRNAINQPNEQNYKQTLSQKKIQTHKSIESTSSDKKKRRTLYKEPGVEKCMLDSQAKAIVKSVRKSMHLDTQPEFEVTKNKRQTVNSLRPVKEKDTNPLISSDDSKKGDADSDCEDFYGFSRASKNCVQNMNFKELGLKSVIECNTSDDIISSNDEVTKTKQRNNEDVEQHNSDDVIVSSDDYIKPNKQQNSEDAVPLNKYTKTNDTVSSKKKRRTMFNLKTDQNLYIPVLNDEEQRKSRRTLKTQIENTKLDKNIESTPSNKKKRRTLFKEPAVEKCMLDSQAKAIVKSVRKSMHLDTQPELKVTEDKRQTVNSLRPMEEKDADPSISSDASKKRESLESEDFGKFVTLRRPRRTGKLEVDKDGFKIPDKSSNSIVIPSNDVSLNESGSTEKLDKSNRTSISSTDCQMSPLELSKVSSRKTSLNSVDMSPLYLVKSETPFNITFSPFEKLVNENTISKLIKTLDTSEISNISSENEAMDENTQIKNNENELRHKTSSELNNSEVKNMIDNQKGTLSECEVRLAFNTPYQLSKGMGKSEVRNRSNVKDTSCDTTNIISSGSLNDSPKIGVRSKAKTKSEVLCENKISNVSFNGVILGVERGKGKENLGARRRSMRIMRKESESLVTSDESSLLSLVIDDSLMTSDGSVEVENNHQEGGKEGGIINETPGKEENMGIIENVRGRGKGRRKTAAVLDESAYVNRGREKRKSVILSKELTGIAPQQISGARRGRRKTILGCLIDDSPLTLSNNSTSEDISLIQNSVVGRGKGRRKTVFATSTNNDAASTELKNASTGLGNVSSASSDGSKTSFYSAENDPNSLDDLNKLRDGTTNEEIGKAYDVCDERKNEIEKSSVSNRLQKETESNNFSNAIEKSLPSNNLGTNIYIHKEIKTPLDTNVVNSCDKSNDLIENSNDLKSLKTPLDKNVVNSCDKSNDLIEDSKSSGNESTDVISDKSKISSDRSSDILIIISDESTDLTKDSSSNGSKVTSDKNDESEVSSKISSSSESRNNISDSNTSAKDTTSGESKITSDESKHSTFDVSKNTSDKSTDQDKLRKGRKQSETKTNADSRDNTKSEKQPEIKTKNTEIRIKGQNNAGLKTDENIKQRKDVVKQTNEDNFNTDKNNSNNEKSSLKKGKRKLFNPNASVTYLTEYDVDEERREHAQKTVLNPSPPIMLTARTKEFVEKNVNAESASENEEVEESDDELINEILTAIKKTPKNKKNEKKQVEINPELDEQKDLYKEFVERKNTKNKKTKQTNDDFEDELNKKKKQSQRMSDLLLPIQRITRRSTMDFAPAQSVTQMSQKRRQRAVKQPTIVCTRFHRDQVVEFRRIVKKLGTFLVQTDVTDRTTHLVAAEPIRTINILRGIARGIWLLKSQWLHDSEKAEKWLPEEDYELVDFSPAVQQCRIERETFGALYSMDIFENCGPIHVVRSTGPKHTDLEDLIKLASGTTTPKSRGASVVVGKYFDYEGVACVAYTWVLDSISENVCKSFEKYLLAK